LSELLEAALNYARRGWCVLPALGKTPALRTWRQYQQKPPDVDQIRQWFEPDAPQTATGIFIVTGAVSRLAVVDCDTPEALAWWEDRLGDLARSTARSTTGRGVHLWFQVERGGPNRALHRDRLQWDLKCDGGGVVAPPSSHPDGGRYQWAEGRGPDSLVVAPEAVLWPSRGRGSNATAQNSPRSMLSKLLTTPPGEGGRNDWLTQVAGHYARRDRDAYDLYELEVAQANQLLGTPLDDSEVAKVTRSIWQAEHAQPLEQVGAKVGLAGPDTGWLVSGDHQILAVCRKAQDRGGDLYLEAWSDFDLVAVGVVEDENAARAYDVIVRRQRFRDERRAVLPAAVLANRNLLLAWLLNLGVSVIPPEKMWPKSGGMSERLSRYLESQHPPKFQVVDSLGWHGDGFICHEGVITRDGLKPLDGRVLDPQRRSWAPYRYGMGDPDAARHILRQVLTFHDETVCAVFGAWWAACLLKPQITARTSMFPIMALQAPSESGKTTGFFAMLMRLGGRSRPPVIPTEAALRDFLSAHQSGIVWVDDPNTTEHLLGLVRSLTADGGMAKKGQDNTTQVDVQLVAPLCLSGEGLGLANQKALLDRSIQLEVPSPVGRRSFSRNRSQWEDIVEFNLQFPDLCDWAGTVVQLALQQADLVDDLRSYTPVESGGGRWGDKMAILRLGARLLSELSHQSKWVPLVDRWVAANEDPGKENALTLSILPELLARTGWQTVPQVPNGRWPATPVFIHDDTVLFHPASCEAWLRELHHGRVSERTETAAAIQEQAQALGCGSARSGEGRRQARLYHPGAGGDSVMTDRRLWYWMLPADVSLAVIARSHQ